MKEPDRNVGGSHDKLLFSFETLNIEPVALRHVCPRSPVIHIIRDGRDAAVSCTHWFKDHRLNDYHEFAQEWAKAVKRIRKVFRNDPLYLEVSYEDMWHNQLAVEKKVFSFLGVSTGRQLMERISTETSFEALSGGRLRGEVASIPNSFKSRMYRKGIIGDWKEHFTPEDKKRFKKVAGDLLQELGYEKSNKW